MDSLIGEVPDIWPQVSLDEVCEILTGPSGARLTLETRTASNVPVVTPKALQDNRITDDGSIAVRPDVAQALARYRLVAGDVVCSRTGDLGRQGLAAEGQRGWLISSACLRLRTKGPISASYLVYYLAHPMVKDWIIRNATGSAIPSLNTRTLSSMPVVLPPMAVQSVVAAALDALDEKIEVHRQISLTTAALRDALLPSLLTGKGVIDEM